MQAFQRDLDRFEKRNAQVLGVSPDRLETHHDFAATYGIEFPLVADPYGKIQRQYAPGRMTYLIAPDGRITYVRKGMPDNDELLEELDRLNP